MGTDRETPNLTLASNERDRLWTAIQEMSRQLLELNKKFEDVIRIEERVGHHSAILERYGTSIERHERDINSHSLQISELSRHDLSDEVMRLRRDLKELREKHFTGQEGTRYADGYSAGRRQIIAGVAKWGGTIVGAYLLFLITQNANGTPPEMDPGDHKLPPALIRKEDDLWPSQ